MTTTDQIALIRRKTYEARKRVLDMTVAAGSGHLTSAYSCAEIVCALYYAVMRHDPANTNAENRDRLILSKNHAALIQYAVFADLGILSDEEILTFRVNGSRISNHASRKVPGMEFSGGSLGMGLGIGAGLAYAAKSDNSDLLTFVILGDAEMCEGSVWESAMFAAGRKLNNLIVTVDRNTLGVTDFTENMVSYGNISDSFNSFGFDTVEVDGHDVSALLDAYSNVRNRQSDKPLCVIANTVKGKGIDFIENDKFMHGAGIKPADVERAYAALESSRGY
jgi:transketolase